jgi:hypothetical protein
MIVLDALVAALRARGLQVIEQPQAATNTNAHLDLWLEGFTLGGERGDSDPLAYETMTLRAEVVSSGVARSFVASIRKPLRIMMRLNELSLIVPVTVPDPDVPGGTKTKKLRAVFEKIAPGGFEYETEEAPMPARFKETWRITITYPASIISQEEG